MTNLSKKSTKDRAEQPHSDRDGQGQRREEDRARDQGDVGHSKNLLARVRPWNAGVEAASIHRDRQPAAPAQRTDEQRERRRDEQPQPRDRVTARVDSASPPRQRDHLPLLAEQRDQPERG